jgi:hypothetical protein
MYPYHDLNRHMSRLYVTCGEVCGRLRSRPRIALGQEQMNLGGLSGVTRARVQVSNR